MKHLILLILVLGLLAFIGFVTGDERHERGSDHAPRHGRLARHEAKKAPETVAESVAAFERKIRTITGRVSATEERAKADARRELEDKVREWLDPQVPASWRPDPRRIDSMILAARITPTEKPYATVYTAEFDADFSAPRRAELLADYGQTVARDRLSRLGGLFAFVLVCLTAVTAYIRADEATKGYQTTRLRLLAAAGVGAAGVLIYQMLA